jgi:hypothetical protein
MIQIDDWVALAIILAFFSCCVCYLVYFVITRKLFPKVKEFQKEISPKNSATILTIEGAGILKKLEMQISENDNSSILVTIDGVGYTTLSIAKETNRLSKERFDEPNGKLFKFEAYLDVKFHKQFSLFIDNRNEMALKTDGKIFYEIKKP